MVSAMGKFNPNSFFRKYYVKELHLVPIQNWIAKLSLPTSTGWVALYSLVARPPREGHPASYDFFSSICSPICSQNCWQICSPIFHQFFVFIADFSPGFWPLGLFIKLKIWQRHSRPRVKHVLVVLKWLSLLSLKKTFKKTVWFLSDPARYLWGLIYGSGCPSHHHFLRFNWCDSGWWRYQLSTNW